MKSGTFCREVKIVAHAFFSGSVPLLDKGRPQKETTPTCGKIEGRFVFATSGDLVDIICKLCPAIWRMFPFCSGDLNDDCLAMLVSIVASKRGFHQALVFHTAVNWQKRGGVGGPPFGMARTQPSLGSAGNPHGLSGGHFLWPL